MIYFEFEIRIMNIKTKIKIQCKLYNTIIYIYIYYCDIFVHESHFYKFIVFLFLLQMCHLYYYYEGKVNPKFSDSIF